MEAKINSVVDSFPRLSNEMYRCKVTVKESTCATFFVKIKVNERVSRKLVLWSVMKVDNDHSLRRVRRYLEYIQDDFLNLALD